MSSTSIHSHKASDELTEAKLDLGSADQCIQKEETYTPYGNFRTYRTSHGGLTVYPARRTVYKLPQPIGVGSPDLGNTIRGAPRIVRRSVLSNSSVLSGSYQSFNVSTGSIPLSSSVASMPRKDCLTLSRKGHSLLI